MPGSHKSRVSMQDIAKELNISRAAVSYVLNNKEDTSVSPATRERILAAAREMNYEPNRLAKALVTGKTFQIDLLLPRTRGQAFQQILELFNQAFLPTAYDLRFSLLNDIVPQGIVMKQSGFWPTDGIIIFDLYLSMGINSLAASTVPMVSVGVERPMEGDYIIADNFQATRTAIQYLQASGRKRVAFLPMPTSEQDARTDAYLLQMRESGTPETVIPIMEELGKTIRRAAMEQVTTYLETNPCPDALFCYNDDIAIGAMRALPRLGLRVPDDVAVVGFDGIADTEDWDPPISTIRYPFQEMATLAREFLLRRIEHPDIPQQTAVLVPQLEIRDTS